MSHISVKKFVLLSIVGTMWLLDAAAAEAAEDSSIRFHVRSANSKEIPCRIHLQDEIGKSVLPRDLTCWDDHFVCDGLVEVHVPPGTYRWEIERGPEFNRLSGQATVQAGSQTRIDGKLRRIANLNGEGWFSGDLHVHRSENDIPILMRAEDLNFAPVIGWWNRPAPDAPTAEQTVFRFDENRIYATGAGEDEREGGALLYFGLRKPLDLSVKSREYPSPMRFVEQAKQMNPKVWVDIEKPFWWDVPTWLATGEMDSIGIANNHMNRTGMFANEAWGRARDSKRLPNPRGNGYWTQEIYYHILNCGLRMPPSAGSASGVLRNPIGYNRVYVNFDSQPFTRDTWFAALKRGRCFVTNGPLLRAKANGVLSGRTLTIDDQPMDVQFAIRLTSNDPVSEVEIIHNGEVIDRIACRKQVDQQLEAKVQIREPGWILLRAIADVDHTFRFASTAPWYIESQTRKAVVSRRSAQFFLDWVNERIERVNTNVEDARQRDSVLHWHVQAREFWLKKREAANVE